MSETGQKFTHGMACNSFDSPCDCGCEDDLRAELTRLQQANVALVDLVRSAYSEGMSEGMKEYTSSKGGKPWFDSKTKQRLEALASQ